MPPARSSILPTLYVCHVDDGGPKIHPCRRVQEALTQPNIAYHKVIAGRGNPVPFLRVGSRQKLISETGTKKLPTLKLADGSVFIHSRAILNWLNEFNKSQSKK